MRGDATGFGARLNAPLLEQSQYAKVDARLSTNLVSTFAHHHPRRHWLGALRAAGGEKRAVLACNGDLKDARHAHSSRGEVS
jgi:hypothetical protein